MKNITPGEILLEEYLKPLQLSQNALSKALGVSARTVNEIVLGRRAISPEMSLRLGVFFEQSAQFWFNIQTTCDFRALKTREHIIRKTIRQTYTSLASA